MADLATNMRDFMYMGNQTTTTYNPDQIYLYSQLIEEETNELFNAIQNDEGDEYKLKEAIDIIVVTLGYIWSYGINPNDVWNLVHSNNMAKVNETVVKDENGKIQKSEASKLAKQKMMSKIAKLLN